MRQIKTSHFLSKSLMFLSILTLFLSVFATASHAEKLKLLIIDGQNNHAWAKTSPVMKKTLLASGRFTVDVSTSPARNNKDKTAWEQWRPDFKKYDVVLSNYNGAMWPDAVQKSFIAYVKGGGGFVCVHAANNSFGNWKEYNEMIGLGGWGGRSEKSGPYVYYHDGKIIKDMVKGRGGSHGRQHPFTVNIRDTEHPITKGLPTEWLHEKDELYDRLRGPAKNMTVLATSFSDPKTGGRGKHEPMMMVLEYGKGRIYHTPMGHADYSMKCAGYIFTLSRGCEWAATGKVTLNDIPKDFPTKDKLSIRDVK